MQKGTQQREQIIFDGEVNYEEESYQNVIPLGIGLTRDPLTLTQLRQLKEIERVRVGESVTDVTLHQILEFLEKVEDEIGSELNTFHFIDGYVTAPNHYNHPETVVTGFKVDANNGDISTETQLKCFKTFRDTELIETHENGLHVKYE